MTVQAEILDLLADLRERTGLALVVVSTTSPSSPSSATRSSSCATARSSSRAQSLSPCTTRGTTTPGCDRRARAVRTGAVPPGEGERVSSNTPSGTPSSALEISGLDVHYGPTPPASPGPERGLAHGGARRDGRTDRRDRLGQVHPRPHRPRARPATAGSIVVEGRTSPPTAAAGGGPCASGASSSTSSRTRCAASTPT